MAYNDVLVWYRKPGYLVHGPIFVPREVAREFNVIYGGEVPREIYRKIKIAAGLYEITELMIDTKAINFPEEI